MTRAVFRMSPKLRERLRALFVEMAAEQIHQAAAASGGVRASFAGWFDVVALEFLGRYDVAEESTTTLEDLAELYRSRLRATTRRIRERRASGGRYDEHAAPGIEVPSPSADTIPAPPATSARVIEHDGRLGLLLNLDDPGPGVSTFVDVAGDVSALRPKVIKLCRACRSPDADEPHTCGRSVF